MHHQGVICTMVHKGDYIFLKIQGTLMIFCFGGSLKTYTKFVCLESVRVGHIDTHTYEKLVVQKVPSYHCE